jgi:hypothetical protein
MARATYSDLIVEVRAQIDVSDDIAFGWLLDRSRVLNAESAWMLGSSSIDVDGTSRWYLLPDDTVWLEAVSVNGAIYQRATQEQLDRAYAGQLNGVRIYADGATGADPPYNMIQIFPDAAGVMAVRYVADVRDDRTLSPPFPPDFDEALVEGAIAMGLARMDERFDSAGYFDERFVNSVARLKRRRHGHIGRGATKIRVLG